MISLRTCLIALAIIIVSIQAVSSIYCWECQKGPKCEETIKKNVTCDTAYNACLSVRTKSKKRFSLECTDKEMATLFCDTGIYVDCKVCEKNNCNSSSFVAPSIFTITIFAVLVTKMYF